MSDYQDEIERLQAAKRRALAVADERAKEANELRTRLASARKALEDIQQRAHEGTGDQMGLNETIWAMHRIASDGLKDITK